MVNSVAIGSKYYQHGCIIKWTQHIGFITLIGMAHVVEGNHENDSKEWVITVKWFQPIFLAIFFS